MSLPYGLLGLLTYNDSTGYDLTKLFEDSLNNFWHAQSSQIYRELNRLEEKGLVSSQAIIQDNRPNKRLYSITANGHEEFQAWLREARLEFKNPHHAILMRVFFGADAPEETLVLLKECRDACKRELEANCAGIRQNIESYADLIPNGHARRRYWEMTLGLGASSTKAMLEWAESCITLIEEELSLKNA